MATTLAGVVSNVAEFCRRQQISRQTFYKWRRRFREGGVDGLVDRSRRPLHPGGLTAPAVEDLVVRERKSPPRGGEVGADAIRWRLQRGDDLPLEQVPSRATVHRILVRRGLVDPAPQKRPKSSLHRFVFARPNDCWQSDWTGWHLVGQTKVAIAGTLDDHSRTACALRAGLGDGTAELVWATMLAAIVEFGVPVRSLTDNGLVYSGARRGCEVPFEANLRALGVATICASPYHPQTCGKIERFWQTLKKWLSAQPTPSTIDELNELLERFRVYYNQQRPHRALDGATPAETFAATLPGRPADRPLPAPVLHQYGTVTETGVVLVGGNHVGVDP